jgi:hypothetical protein
VSALLLALELRELPVLDQEIKTRTACVGLLVAPFVHAEFAIDEEFLALLNELAEILGGSTPDFEVDKSGDLLFLPLSVSEVLVVGDRSRQNSFPARGVSEFGISGEVASDDDFVDVHNDDLGLLCVFRDCFGINFDASNMRHVASNCKQNFHLFLLLMVVPERVVARYVTVFRIGSSTRRTSPTCTRVSTRNLSQHRCETRSLISVSIERAEWSASALSA